MEESITYVKSMSPTIGALVAALAKAQGQMTPAVKDTRNPFFNSKYADLSAVWDAIRGPLSANGLAVIQAPAESSPDVVMLDTLLAHSSGEWVISRLCMKPSKSDPQGIGSCLTYARRYALGAITGVATEEDDDGNAASKATAAKTTPMREKVMAQANEGGAAPDSVPTVNTPVALPSPTVEDRMKGNIHAEEDLPWQKGIVAAIEKAPKPTKEGNEFGKITLETLEGSTIEATWFGFSKPWTYDLIREHLCGRTIDVEFVVKPASNPRYKPTLEHFRCDVVPA